MIIKKTIFIRIYSWVSIILLRDFIANQRGEDIFEPTIGNKILEQDSS